jgi:hypothetical protein
MFDLLTVLLQNAYSGTTNFDAIKSGGDVRINLGENRNIEISATTAVPLNNKMVEDKSTWFVKDKEKFRVKTEETLFSVRNLHPTISAEGNNKNEVLVILAENLPKSSDADISVELLSPSKQDLQRSLESVQKLLNTKLKTSASNAKEFGQLKLASDSFAADSTVQGESYLSAVIYAATQMRASSGSGSAGTISSSVGNPNDPNSLFVFMNKNANTVYWVKWLPAGQTFASSYKYRITWPDNRPSIIVV